MLLARGNLYFQGFLAHLQAENANSAAPWAAPISAVQVAYPYVVLRRTLLACKLKKPHQNNNGASVTSSYDFSHVQGWCFWPTVVIWEVRFPSAQAQLLWMLIACIGSEGSERCEVADLIPKLVSGVRNELLKELIVGRLGWSSPCCPCF